jgi:hypothetical protein
MSRDCGMWRGCCRPFAQTRYPGGGSVKFESVFYVIKRVSTNKDLILSAWHAVGSLKPAVYAGATSWSCWQVDGCTCRLVDPRTQNCSNGAIDRMKA